MAEYTWKNLIYNPTLEEAKNAIGKECYFGSTPIGCIKNANDDKNSSVLREVRSNEFLPFITSNYGCYSCIIVKEEQKPKYIPFESIEEFVERYTEVKEGVEFGTFEDNLLQCGMWLKSKDGDDLSQVIVIKEYGICIDTMSTIVLWKNLLDDFEFIDGTPCGKLVEESNA